MCEIWMNVCVIPGGSEVRRRRSVEMMMVMMMKRRLVVIDVLHDLRSQHVPGQDLHSTEYGHNIVDQATILYSSLPYTNSPRPSQSRKSPTEILPRMKQTSRCFKLRVFGGVFLERNEQAKANEEKKMKKSGFFVVL